MMPSEIDELQFVTKPYASDMTVIEARTMHQKLRKQQDGTCCPVCDKFGKEYKRKLNRTMARSLIWLVKEYERTGAWVKIAKTAPKFVLASNQIVTLRAWDLIIVKDNDDPTKSSSNLLKPTEDGIDFVYGRVEVPSHHFEYRGEVLGHTEEYITIYEAIGDFNYAALMSSSGRDTGGEGDEGKRTSDLGGGNHRSR